MRELAEQLRALCVACFPCWVRHNAEKGKWDKGPRVPKGEPWQFAALRPVNDPTLDWSSGVLGVPIPAGVVVLDIDAYKGATREAINGALGTVLPWDAALIQSTISGGEHYAFRVDWDVRQGDDLCGIAGFDTRSAGRGFICSGEGYTQTGNGGVLALGDPQRLPVLPEAVRVVLEKVETVPMPAGDYHAPEGDDTLSALKHIDPQCSRLVWRNIGYALKALYANDDAEGLALFEAWSSGELWDGTPPDNYVSAGKGSSEDQWPTFKSEGGVNPSTLYYHAIQGGWRPPARFDAAAAFGANAAPASAFDALVEQIRSEGSDIKATQSIIDAIQAAGCNALQVALLAAELKTELKDAGISDKALTKHIDGLLQTAPPEHLLDTAPAGMYGKNDTDNAAVFLDKFYANGWLRRCDGLFYKYTGKAWESLTNETVRNQLTIDMAAQRMQESKISACFRMVTNLAPVMDGALGEAPDNLIIFDNGILDLNTGIVGPHTPEVFSTNIMPYAFNPHGQCPNWLAFLDDVFSGDGERIALLQEWMGYLLTRSYRHQKLMFMLGGPGSGKGTIGRVLAELVGPQNFSGGALSKLASDSYLDAISDKPVVFIGDAAKKVSPMKINDVIETIKAVSGNDEVSWHRMYRGAVSRTLPSRFTLAANSVPALFDDSGALSSRLLLLVFDKSYRNTGQEDLGLGDRLLTEMEGVAVWALEGLRRLNTVGRFTSPAISREESAMIDEAYSPIKVFIDECCETDRNYYALPTDVYEAYRAWAVNNGEEPMRPRTLTSTIRDAYRGRGVWYGCQWIDGRTVRAFKGLRIKGGPIDRVVKNPFELKAVE